GRAMEDFPSTSSSGGDSELVQEELAAELETAATLVEELAERGGVVEEKTEDLKSTLEEVITKVEDVGVDETQSSRGVQTGRVMMYVNLMSVSNINDTDLDQAINLITENETGLANLNRLGNILSVISNP